MDKLNELINIANEKYDGHFTLMKFTSNYRCCLGTIHGDCKAEIIQMAEGETMEESIDNAIKNNVNSYNFNHNDEQVWRKYIFNEEQ